MSLVRRSTRATPCTAKVSGCFSRRNRRAISAGSSGTAAPDRTRRPSRAARRRGGGRGTESPTPASMRDSSATRVVAVDDVDADATVRCARPAAAATACSTAFSTTTWVSANAATCARWVTQSTWCRRPSVCQQTADRDAGLTADPGVHLVEHQRRRRLGEHHARRQHRTGELAAGRGPGERSGRLARVGGQQERDPVGAVVGRLARLDHDLDQPHGASPARGGAPRWPGPAARRPPRRAADERRRPRPRAAAACSRPAALERGRAVPRSPPARRAGPPASTPKAITSARVSPYLRPSSWSCWRRARTVSSRSGSSATRSTSRRSSCSMSASSACTPRRRGRELGERRPAVERGDRVPERVEAAAFERVVRARRARRGARPRRRAAPPRLRARRPRRRRRAAAAAISSTWKRSRSISRARARASPPRASSSASSARTAARASR